VERPMTKPAAGPPEGVTVYRATRNGADAIERSQRLAIRPLSVVMSMNSHASSSTR